MDSKDFRSELEAMPWNDLRAKASKEYGIKILPEYKRDDIIRFIVDREAGPTKYVTDNKALDTKNERYGWSRVRVLPGRKETDTHARACHNGYQFAIPFDVELNLPTVTAEYLTTKKVPYPYTTDSGSTEIRFEPRWNVLFVERNYGPNGEKDYIPVEARGKYWTGMREAKLKVKRDFYARFGYWPTDKVMKEALAAGRFALPEVSGGLNA